MRLRLAAILALASMPLLARAPAPPAFARWSAAGERGVMIVEVSDVQRQPVEGALIGAGGSGAAAFTDALGRARVRLAPGTAPGVVVPLRFRAPHGRRLVFLSPWDGQAPVPPFDDEARNFVRAVVVEPGVRTALESGAFLQAYVERVEGRASRASARLDVGIAAEKTAAVRARASTPTRTSARADAGARAQDSARADVAREMELPMAALDSAVRTWGDRTSDPYQRGLAALYEEQYAKAVASLQAALASGDAVVEGRVYDRNFFLGRALSAVGRYAEATTAFDHALRLRPGDAGVMIELGIAHRLAGDSTRADDLLRRALAIKTRRPSGDYPPGAREMPDIVAPNSPRVPRASNTVAVYPFGSQYNGTEHIQAALAQRSLLAFQADARWTVLDRSSDAALQKEIDRIRAPETFNSEVRLRDDRQLNARYVLWGYLERAGVDQSSQGYNAHVEFVVRLINVETGQSDDKTVRVTSIVTDRGRVLDQAKRGAVDAAARTAVNKIRGVFGGRGSARASSTSPATTAGNVVLPATPDEALSRAYGNAQTAIHSWADAVAGQITEGRAAAQPHRR